MTSSIDVEFASDYDSDLYMLSTRADAGNWKVVVHLHDGKTVNAPRAKFVPYPGCAKHEGETAWCVDFVNSAKIEIRVSDLGFAQE